MPEGHHRVQAGKVENDVASILVEIGDQAGRALDGCGDGWKLQSEERDGDAQPRCCIPAADRQRDQQQIKQTVASLRRDCKPAVLRSGRWGGAGQAQDQPGQHQHEHRKPQRKVEQRRIVDHLAAAFGGQPGTENQRAVSQ